MGCRVVAELSTDRGKIIPGPDRVDRPEEQQTYRIHAAAVALLGFTTLLFTSINMRFLLRGEAEGVGEIHISLVLMAMALLIAAGVVVITSYVVKMVKSQAEVRLELERLRSKADLADSLREMRHDFDNQLTVVLALLQLGRVEGAVDYLHGIVGRKPYLLEGGGVETFFPFLAEKSLEAIEREVAIHYDVRPCALPLVPIDVITRIIGNLFDNAVEAATQAPGGGQVKVSMYVENDNWSFKIWNNGTSIPPALMERIFDSGVTTKQESEGHGLGLAVVRRLVDTHQGTIRVESDPRLGTTFHLSFALSPVYSSFAHNR